MKREDAYEGARVIALSEQDCNSDVIGETGTIVCIFENNNDWCLVCFDKDVNGHSANRYGPRGCCWDMNYDNIEFYEDAERNVTICFDDLEL